MNAPDPSTYQQLVELARAEDLGPGDITSEITIDAGRTGCARLVFRQAAVVCGLPIAEQVLAAYDGRAAFRAHVSDGDRVDAHTVAGTIEGSLRSLLAAERVMLNFVGRLSGVATMTRRYVEAVAGTAAVICDTRKTTPGWRALEKYAVRCGGGTNHRQGLYDAVLVKDNHLADIGSDFVSGLRQALDRLKNAPRRPAFVEVEVDTLDQLRAVLPLPGIDMVLLDNMSLDQLRHAVSLRDRAGLAGKLLLEASGNVRLDTIGDIALTGVDRISAGALTHSVATIDVALDLQ